MNNNKVLYKKGSGEEGGGGVSVVLVPGWFDPNMSWQELAPVGVDIYEGKRPGGNPKILDKLVGLVEIKSVVAIHPYFDMVEHRMDWNQTAEYIKNILDDKGVDPPYILIGHSAGYRILHVFSDLYSKDVIGLITIDGSQRVRKSSLEFTTLGPKPDDDDDYSKFKKNLVDTYDQISYPSKFTKRVIVFSVLNVRKKRKINKKFGDPVKYFKKITKRNAKSKLVIVRNKGHFIHHAEPGLIIDLVKDMMIL